LQATQRVTSKPLLAVYLKANSLPFVLLVGGGIGIFFQYLMGIGKDQYSVQKAKMDERKAAAGGSKPVEPKVAPAAKKAAPKKKPAAKK